MLDDIREYTTELQSSTPVPVPENVAAVRWLDRRFEPIIAAIPGHLLVRLEAAEIFHQPLEHRWYLAERLGHDVTLEEALRSYLDEILATSPDERPHIDEPTAEIPRTEPVP